MSPSKSNKRKQKGHDRQESLEGLRRKLARGPLRDMEMRTTSGGEPKMSDVLLAFVEPYRRYADTEAAFHKLLSLAVTAWDASFLPDEEQQGMIDHTIAAAATGASEEVRADLKRVVNQLIARKRSLFAEDRRMILDYQVEETDEGMHLFVASASMEAA